MVLSARASTPKPAVRRLRTSSVTVLAETFFGCGFHHFGVRSHRSSAELKQVYFLFRGIQTGLIDCCGSTKLFDVVILMKDLTVWRDGFPLYQSHPNHSVGFMKPQ